MIRVIYCLFYLMYISCSPSLPDKENNHDSKSKNINSLIQSQSIKLSTPIVLIDSIFFATHSKVSLDFGLPGSTIYYSLDNMKFHPYRKSLIIEDDCKLQVYAHHPQFLNSDTLEFQVLKVNQKLKPEQISINPLPSQQYPGKGTLSLSDLIKGSLDFRSDVQWIGFQESETNISVRTDQLNHCQDIYISTLSDINSWISVPRSIEVFSHDVMLSRMDFQEPNINDAPKFKVVRLEIPDTTYSDLSIKFINWDSLPDWHPGKGSLPWIFIDELIIK